MRIVKLYFLLPIFSSAISIICITDFCFSQYPQLFVGPRQAGSAIDENIADVCAADVDNDGDLDLIGVYPAGPELAVCYNDGLASFSQPWYVNENAGTADLVQSVAVGDLDGDGYIDLVSGTWNGFFGVSGDENSVAINLNNGDGTFAKATMIPVLGKTNEVVTGDFDNDGDIDIAATHINFSSISVLLNNGDGTFSPFQHYQIGDGAWTLYAAEISGDEYLDLIVACLQGELFFLINNGGGEFIVDKKILEPGLQNVHGGDVDEDGDHDLVTLNSSTNTIKILINDGAGSFTQANSYTSHHWLNSLFIADFDGDEHLDFCVTNYDTSTISVFKGDGNASFTESEDYFIGENPHDILAADLNNDGANDIIACASGLWARAIINQGNGTFETIDQYYKIVKGPIAIEAADFNGDGFKDMLFYSGDYMVRSLFMSITFNDGFGYFPDYTSFGGDHLRNESPVSGGKNAIMHPFTIADFDNDGDIDIAAAMGSSYATAFFKIFKNNGSGKFARDETEYIVSSTTFSSIKFMKSSDIDNDGNIDIIHSGGNQGNPTWVAIRYNNGSAQFDSAKLVMQFDNVEAPIPVLEVSDFNGDGLDDIIFSDSQYFNEKLFIAFNNNDGNFDINEFNGPWQESYHTIVAGDYDNDGDNDFGIIYSATPMITHKGQVYINDGSGGFTIGSDLHFPGQSPSWAIATDIDRDGDLDIIGCTQWNRCITVNINDGNGNFEEFPPLQYTTIGHARSLVASDFNNDGFDDIATVNYVGVNTEGTLTILTNALSGQAPVLAINPDTLFFGISDTSKTFTINNTGSGSLIWSAFENPDQDWITSINPTNGVGDISINVKVSRTDLSSGSYSGKITISSNGGSSDLIIRMEVLPTGVNINKKLPNVFSISQNYPNPFNPVTTIKYQLPQNNTHVTLTIYNSMGQKVATLVDESMNAGYHSVNWHAREIASGLYFYKIKAGNFERVRKMLLLQ